MFRLITQVFIILLRLIGSLVTKYVSLSNEPCMDRPTLIDSHPIELDYYPLMIILDKCNGNCNAVYDLSTKICVPSKTKVVNLKFLIW